MAVTVKSVTDQQSSLSNSLSTNKVVYQDISGHS